MTERNRSLTLTLGVGAIVVLTVLGARPPFAKAAKIGPQPFNQFISFAAPFGGFFTVPADQRLVVEFVTGLCFMDPTTDLLHVSVQFDRPHLFAPVQTGIFTGGLPQFKEYVFSQEMRVFVSPGRQVLALAATSPTDPRAQCDLSFSGYLQDAREPIVP